MYSRIDGLQLRNIPLNLYFKRDGTTKTMMGVIVPRKAEASGVFWNPWAFCEIGGRIVVERPKDFNNANEISILSAFKNTTYARFDREQFEKKPVIFVTGGAGFLGSHYVRYLLEKHPAYDVRVLDLPERAAPLRRVLGANVTIIEGDLIVLQDLASILSEVDRVVHLAGQTSVDEAWKRPDKTREINVGGTRRLLDAVFTINQGRKKAKKPLIELLYVSAEHVYGPKEQRDSSRFHENDRLNPKNPYASSKMCAEKVIESYQTTEVPAIIVRSSRMYGPGQEPTGLVSKLVQNALMQESFPVYGLGQEIRDKLYIDDGIRGIDCALHKGAPGEAYNLSAGEEISNLGTARKILEAVRDPHLRIEHNVTFERPLHDFSYRLDASKIREKLGWHRTIVFGEGLKRTIAATRQQLIDA